MVRGTRPSRARAAFVWSSVTAAATVALWTATPLVVPAAWDASASFADLLVRVSAAVLGVALLWLWVVTTVTVGQLLVGTAPSGAGATRRLVLLACGAALAASVTQPAFAAEGTDVLEGLRLPERAVAASTGSPPVPSPRVPSPPVPAPPVTSPRTPAAERPMQPAGSRPSSRLHVVRPGESLWSIAAATSPTVADVDVDVRWRSIWAANRDVVGEDPDLILPGQRLRIPAGGGVHGEAGTATAADADGNPAQRPAEQPAKNPANSPDETGDRP